MHKHILYFIHIRKYATFTTGRQLINKKEQRSYLPVQREGMTLKAGRRIQE
jgi:hypothetical protein